MTKFKSKEEAQARLDELNQQYTAALGKGDTKTLSKLSGLMGHVEDFLKRGDKPDRKPKPKSKPDVYGPVPMAGQAGTGQGTRVMMRKLSEVDAKPVRWLWPGRIPCGKLTMLSGDPGLGKSQLTIALAGIVSRGGAWPVDGSACEQGAMIFLSAEDDAADTIVPRLQAVGADLSQCHILDGIEDVDEKGSVRRRPFSLKTDLPRLYARMLEIGNVKLIVIDPITAYLGGGDANSTTDVRDLLSPLGNIAEATGAAIIGVGHLNKSSSQSALQRTSGSMAFVAQSRAALIVLKDKANPQRRLLLPQKYNLAKDGGGLAFSIQSVALGEGIETSRVEWEPEAVTMTADEAIGDDAEEKAGALQEAKKFIAELLAEGPVKSKEADQACKDAGIAWITKERAKKALGVESNKLGKGPYQWSLPRSITEENDTAAQTMIDLDRPPMNIGFQGSEISKVYHPEGMIDQPKSDFPAIAEIGGEAESETAETADAEPINEL